MIITRDETRDHLRNPQGHESSKHTAQVLTRTNGHCNNNRQDYGNKKGTYIQILISGNRGEVCVMKVPDGSMTQTILYEKITRLSAESNIVPERVMNKKNKLLS